MQNLIDVGSLLARSGANHVRYFLPAATQMSPPQYAGKVESVGSTIALDALGVRMSDVADPMEFARFTVGVNVLWRANDEVVDQAKPYIDETVTGADLNNTPVFHPYAGPNGRYITGLEGLNILLDSAARLIPGNTTGAIRRRTAIEEYAAGYTQIVADTANDPAFQSGEILPYSAAMQSKKKVTGGLGEMTVGIMATALDIPERENDKRLCRKIAVAMQIGDDIGDWRKDWSNYTKMRQESARPLRPQENLFNALLQQSPHERAVCEAVLKQQGKRSAVLARDVAPETFTGITHEFNEILGTLPKHPYRDRGARVMSFMFRQFLLRAPETGRFARWAKY